MVSVSSIGLAALTGFVSWRFLNHCTIYGDYALVGFTAACSLLYLGIRTNNVESALHLTIGIAGTYVLSLGLATISYRLSLFHPLAKYSGPLLWRTSSLPLVIVSVMGHRHLVIEALHRQYGKVIRIGPNLLSVNSFPASNAIYGHASNMAKSDYYRLPGRLGTVSLFFQQTREAHTTRKQIWQQAFTTSAIAHFERPLERLTWQLMDYLERCAAEDGDVNIEECLSHWSYDFMGEMVFGGSNVLELMKHGDPRGLIAGGKRALAIHDSCGQAQWLLDILWHIPAGRSMHYLRDIAASMMRTRVHTGAVNIRDLSSYLLDGHPRTGQQISLSDLEIDAVVAIQGGSDGPAITLTMALYFILSTPSVYKDLQDALDRAFPDHHAPLDRKLLASIPILDAVLTETLRLSPAVFMPRVVPPGGAIIEGTLVLGGTVVAVAAYSQHISEENFFPDPLKFRPERWLPGSLGPESITNKAAILSFSTGPYVCVGKSLAMQEMRVCLARLVLTFDMSFSLGFDGSAFLSGLRYMRTTFYDRPLSVKLTRREGRQTPVDAYY